MRTILFLFSGRDDKKDNKSGIWGRFGQDERGGKELRAMSRRKKPGILSCPALSLFHVDFTSSGGGYLFCPIVLLRLPLLSFGPLGRFEG